MTKLLKQFFKLWREELFLLIPLFSVSSIFSSLSYEMLEKIVGQSLLDNFPITSTIFMVLNALLLSLFIGAVVTVGENGAKFIPFVIGPLVGFILQGLIFFRIIKVFSVVQHSFEAHDLYFVLAVTYFIAIVTAICTTTEENIKEQDEVMVEPTRDVVSESTMEMSLDSTSTQVENSSNEAFSINHLDILSISNIHILHEVFDIQTLYNHLKKEQLSTEAEHALMRSQKQLYQSLNHYMKLYNKEEETSVTTMLAILHDIKEEYQTLLHTKEKKTQAELQRLLLLRKEKSTY